MLCSLGGGQLLEVWTLTSLDTDLAGVLEIGLGIAVLISGSL